MRAAPPSRRSFLYTGLGAVGALALKPSYPIDDYQKPVVSVVKIENNNIDYAVEKAIDLLGGIETVAKDKERIMLKPNLVNPSPSDTTKPDVVKAVARLMINAGKDVSIGEGTGGALNFNLVDGVQYRTKSRDILDRMQKYTFDELGYSDLAKSLMVPLINLHTGDLVEVSVPNAFVFDKITLHRSLTESDLVCSIPMMKTHSLAYVTLGLKNFFGAYPGAVYYSVRTGVHNKNAEVEETGTAASIIDMVRANKTGLTVIDGSMAMEGQGPNAGYGGKLVKMDLIIAGTSPLAADIAASCIMGFKEEDIPTFAWAAKAGMTPTKLEDIEIRGEEISKVCKPFLPAKTIPWKDIQDFFGADEIG